MGRFLSPIILIFLSPFCQSKVFFFYLKNGAIKETPASFAVSVEYEETEFSNFAVRSLKSTTDPQPLESAGEYTLSVTFTYIEGTLSKDSMGVCNILSEARSSGGRSVTVTTQTPKDTVTQMNSSLNSGVLADGVNYKTSMSAGSNFMSLTFQRASPELAKAIVRVNCKTLSITYKQLI